MPSIANEFSRLRRVIIGRGAPYQRDRPRAAEEMREFPLVPDTPRRPEVLAMTYPTESILEREYANFVPVLERHGVQVLRADPEAAYSFDYTCPRDIGFVIHDLFFIANMAVASRSREIETIRLHLDGAPAEKIIRPPQHCRVEGGDVIVLDEATVLAGYHLRSNREAAVFLGERLAPLGIRVIPVRHTRLHLDCCLNPLGRGHLLIHADSLQGNDPSTWRELERFTWVRVDDEECEHLATNVLSIDPHTLISRDHPACARVNRVLGELGYTVETVGFDGVPATGGSFRCASLPLARGHGPDDGRAGGIMK